MEKSANRLWFLPYNNASEGLKNIAQILMNKLEVKLIKSNPLESNFKASKGKTVINWGNSTLPAHVDGCTIINHPDALHFITHKGRFFDRFKDVARLPQYTKSNKEAAEWAPAEPREGIPFAMARTVLQGHSGEGIVEIYSANDLKKIKDGTLITRYVPKKSEWRLHFSVKDGLFYTQKKVRRNEVAEPNWRVRNFENGFNFANGEDYTKEVPKDVVEQAKKVFAASDLHFGAIDVIYNERHDQAFVLEVNSAPGATGTTADKYAEMIERLIK